MPSINQANEKARQLQPVRAIIMPPLRRKDMRPSLATLEAKRKTTIAAVRVACGGIAMFCALFMVAMCG